MTALRRRRLGDVLVSSAGVNLRPPLGVLDDATYEIKVQCGEKYEISVNDIVLNDAFMQHSGVGVHEVRVIVPHSIP